LAYAAHVKATAVPGDISIGWKFPKEDQITKVWADWAVLYDQQSDLEAFFKNQFETEVEAHKQALEEEKKEMEG